MKIIDRYILKSLVGPFFFAVITLLFVLILQFFTTFADRFIGKGIGFSDMAELILLQSAWMVGLAAPMAVLVAVVMTFGSLTTTSEMTIFRASGISLYRVMIPVLFAGLILSLLVERFNNIVLPQANYHARSMMVDIARSKPAFGLTENAFSTLVDGYSIFVRKYDDRSKELQGIVLYNTTRPEYNTMATAEKGSIDFAADYQYLIMTLYNGEIHQVSRKDYKSYRKMSFAKHRVVFEASGFGFARSSGQGVRTDNAEMSADELLAIGNEFRRRVAASEKDLQMRSKISGQSVGSEISGERKNIEFNRMMYNKYMVAYHKKYALSLACFVFVLVGAPLGVLARRGGFGVGASMSLLFFVLYWMLMISGEKMAERALVDPMISLWMANIVMAAIGIGLVVTLTGAVFNTSR